MVVVQQSGFLNDSQVIRTVLVVVEFVCFVNEECAVLRVLDVSVVVIIILPSSENGTATLSIRSGSAHAAQLRRILMRVLRLLQIKRIRQIHTIRRSHRILILIRRWIVIIALLLLAVTSII